MKNSERKRIDRTKYLIEFSLNGTKNEVELAGRKSEDGLTFSVFSRVLAVSATESYHR